MHKPYASSSQTISRHGEERKREATPTSVQVTSAAPGRLTTPRRKDTHPRTLCNRHCTWWVIKKIERHKVEQVGKWFWSWRSCGRGEFEQNHKELIKNTGKRRLTRTIWFLYVKFSCKHIVPCTDPFTALLPKCSPFCFHTTHTLYTHFKHF